MLGKDAAMGQPAAFSEITSPDAARARDCCARLSGRPVQALWA